MARIARVVLPGRPHHVTQCGVRSMDVFRDDADRAEYLRLMAEQGARYGLRFLSWCLMSNHVHLIVVPNDETGFARGIGEAHRRYSSAVNAREGTRGYFFQGRFQSCPLDQRHLLAAVRYVERNPVRARLVRQAWTWPWSSAAFHVGRRPSDPLVQKVDLLGLVDDWREFLRRDPEEIGFLRQRTRTGRPCGDKRFMALAERRTGRRLHRLPPGRPPGTGRK